jgi:hypothetical protein
MADILPLEPRSGQDLEALRTRLHAAELNLGPVDGSAQLAERLHDVARELESIHRDIRLILHLVELEESDFEETIAGITKNLADGWKPDSSPVSEVVARLRAASEA